MFISKFLLPILKENPSEASIASHRLMLRSGMIRQVASGIYTWLPLGTMVLRNIENIVRKNMNEIGCQEMIMPIVQPASLWQESGRYDDYGLEMLKFKDRHEVDMLFGPTAEEIVNDVFRKNIVSYKDLPKNLYQINWKFRDEIRPRFGVMRGREFLMKDGYSFDLNEENAKETYNNMYKAYIKAFRDMGLNPIPVRADTGPIGGDLSHEFHVMASTGESQIYYDKKFDELLNKDDFDVEQMKSLYAAADDLHIQENCPVKEGDLVTRRGIEVGHIFYYATKYSDTMDITVMGNDGKPVKIHGGCYGIGVSRLAGAIIEANHDENGIIWPNSIAPFKVSLINLKPGAEETDKMAMDLYQKLEKQGVSVIYDDSNNNVGSKFATHDLIGSPLQIIIGPRLATNNMLELKHRRSGQKEELSLESAFNKIVKIFV